MNTVSASRVGSVGKYDEVLNPFMGMMEKELHANSGKGDRPGWLSMSADTCMLEIYYHLGKLQKAVKDGNGDGICEFAADVANLSMMLTDICGALNLFAAAQPADQQGEPSRPVKRYERDAVSGHCDVEIGLLEHKILHHDHGPNLAEAVARLAYRIAKFHNLHAPTLASHAQPATAKVVLPQHKDSDLRSPVYGHAQGWNACLDEVAKLNGINT